MSRHVNTFRVSLILAIAVIATFALGAHQSVRSDQRQREHPDRHHKNRELWVTHQRDSTISVLSFPEGKLLERFSLPDGADADHAVVAAGGHGGHIYTLDMATDTLEDRGTLGAMSWHSFNMTPDEALGFGTSPNSDEVVVIDLTTDPVTNLGTIVLQPLPGTGNNQPDAVGGGEPLVHGILPVTLRASGQLALVKTVTGRIKRFIELAEPSPPATFNPMNCNDCSVHGVTVRRTVVPRRARSQSRLD